MILKTLKSNKTINLLIFPILGILFWISNLIRPFSYKFYEDENNNILYAPLNKITEGSDFVRVLLSLIFVIVIAFLIQGINDRFSFIRIRTKLPATLFVIIVSGFTQLHTLHPVFPAVIFLLFAIYSLFDTFEEIKPYSKIFNTGFLIGVGTLFYLNILILLPAFFVGVAILTRESSWRSYLILLIGFFVPIFFEFSYAVLTEQIPEMLDIISKNTFTHVNYFLNNTSLQIFLALLIILTIIGSIKIMQQYDSKKVSTRKYFTIFFIIFFLSLISFAFFPVTSQEMLIIIAIPITYLISNLLLFMKSRFWSELLFILLLGIVVFTQFF